VLLTPHTDVDCERIVANLDLVLDTRNHLTAPPGAAVVSI
jgi:hypothetical protein